MRLEEAKEVTVKFAEYQASVAENVGKISEKAQILHNAIIAFKDAHVTMTDADEKDLADIEGMAKDLVSAADYAVPSVPMFAINTPEDKAAAAKEAVAKKAPAPAAPAPAPTPVPAKA